MHSSLKDAESGAKTRRRTGVAGLPVRRLAYRAASLSEAELTAGAEEERRKNKGEKVRRGRESKEEETEEKSRGKEEVGGGRAEEKIIKGGNGSERRSNSRPWPSGGPASFSCSHFTNKLY